MKYEIDDIEYDVVITKKKNKNTYIRVKDDGKIYVTTNYLATNSYVKKILDSNILSIKKMLTKVDSKREKKDTLFYLNHRYDIIVVPVIKNIQINDNMILTPSLKAFDKWLKSESLKVFKERYEHVLSYFNEDIYVPTLKVRTMKTRWGVYNRRSKTITLNTRLLEYGYDEIDYVIVHELSHIIYFNHSKDFWNLVSIYCPNYKKIRRNLKE